MNTAPAFDALDRPPHLLLVDDDDRIRHLLNRYLSQLTSDRGEYQPMLTETHHLQKLDAPSGTALTLAHDLMAAVPRLANYQLYDESSDTKPPAAALPITSIREGDVPGTHFIRWQSDVDEISIEHRAHSRAGFAWGALAAAQWIAGTQGVFTMSDVLNIR